MKRWRDDSIRRIQVSQHQKMSGTSTFLLFKRCTAGGSERRSKKNVQVGCEGKVGAMVVRIERRRIGKDSGRYHEIRGRRGGKRREEELFEAERRKRKTSSRLGRGEERRGRGEGEERKGEERR
eukprot:6616-Hanusia_phi.AAC.1